MRGIIGSQSEVVWPSRDKPKNFSLALKKSMLSVPRLVELQVFWVVWSLLQLSELLLGEPLGSRGTSEGQIAIGVFEDAKSPPASLTLLSVSEHNSKLKVPEGWEFLRELFWSGTSRDSSGTVGDSHPWREVDGERGRVWMEGRDWRRATGFAAATFRRHLSAKFCSGTTVAARARGRVGSKGSSHGSSELSWLIACVERWVWVFSVPGCELLIVWSTLFTERVPLGLCWLLCGSERPRVRGFLHTGSCCSDRSLSEWDRHNLLCLCLLKAGRSTGLKFETSSLTSHKCHWRKSMHVRSHRWGTEAYDLCLNTNKKRQLQRIYARQQSVTKNAQLRNVTKQLLPHKAHVTYTQQTQYSEPLHFCTKSLSKWKD